MRAILTVDMDGAAFADPHDWRLELARLLRETADALDVGIPGNTREIAFTAPNDRPLRDINGNRVGELRIEDGATPGEHCHRCGKPATAYVTDGPVCAGHKARLRDINGNRVGELRIEEDPPKPTQCGVCRGSGHVGRLDRRKGYRPLCLACGGTGVPRS